MQEFFLYFPPNLLLEEMNGDYVPLQEKLLNF